MALKIHLNGGEVDNNYWVSETSKTKIFNGFRGLKNIFKLFYIHTRERSSLGHFRRGLYDVFNDNNINPVLLGDSHWYSFQIRNYHISEYMRLFFVQNTDLCLGCRNLMRVSYGSKDMRFPVYHHICRLCWQVWKCVDWWWVNSQSHSSGGSSLLEVADFLHEMYVETGEFVQSGIVQFKKQYKCVVRLPF